MKRAELYSQLAQLTDAQLVQLVQLAQVLGSVPSTTVAQAKPDKALVVVPTVAKSSEELRADKVQRKLKDGKFNYKRLACTKGIPSKVWSAIHHNVVENGGTWDRQDKVWKFKTIKACKTVYETQLKFAQSKGVEMPIEAF